MTQLPQELIDKNADLPKSFIENLWIVYSHRDIDEETKRIAEKIENRSLNR